MSWTKEEFSRTVMAHSRAMFRAARGILDSDAAAEDAVGEAILSAWQGIGRLRDRAAVRTWLLKITVNCAYRQRRQDSRIVWQADTAEITEDPHRYDDLWEAVCALPAERRTVVTLFYYEDMTVAEIAKCLKLPEGTVKSRLSRAREQLKVMLCEEE